MYGAVKIVAKTKLTILSSFEVEQYIDIDIAKYKRNNSSTKNIIEITRMKV
jgi:hypothetical protein